MNQVKRAIIMAAGIGSRLAPITKETPKPLVKVRGVRMIDTIIHALHQNGITEIYVVVGYMKEKFSDLPKQYPGLQIIENPFYNTCNNISSLYVARKHLDNVMILDGDQIIQNPKALSPYFERSGYNCVWTEKETDEWLLQAPNGIVNQCSKTGGRHGWQLFSVSRWNKEDGMKLKKHLELEFDQNNNKQIYWDDVALFCHPEDYELGIHAMQPGDVIEVDNFSELVELDNSYSKIMEA